jgi:hypothetical protein
MMAELGAEHLRICMLFSRTQPTGPTEKRRFERVASLSKPTQSQVVSTST